MKMGKKLVSVSLVLLLLSVLAVSGASADTNIFTDPLGFYSFKYPASCEENTDKGKGITFLVDAVQKGVYLVHREPLTGMDTELPPEIGLPELFAIEPEAEKEVLKSFEQFKKDGFVYSGKSTMKVQGYKAMVYDYTHADGGFMRLIIFIKGKSLYMGMSISDADNKSNSLQVINKILASLTFMK